MAEKSELRLISFRIPQDLLTRIDNIAGAKGDSRTQVIEELLRDSIEHEEQLVRAMTDPIVGPAILSALAKPEVMRALTSSLRQDLTDEQLQLFQRATESISAVVTSSTPAPKVTPRRRPPTKKGKR